jgi:hypothetical protein
VKSDSPIKTIKDFDGKTIAFSTVGASTHGVVTAFIKQYGLTAAKPARREEQEPPHRRSARQPGRAHRRLHAAQADPAQFAEQCL